MEVHPRVTALDEKRSKARISVEELVAEAPISRSTYYRWTKGAGLMLSDLEKTEAELDRLILARAEEIKGLAS
jgi:predicted transcriptional regulator